MSWLAAVGLALVQGAASAAPAPGPGGIYSCVDAGGKRLTSDRPIAECNAREQRVLNADGSVRRVLPPTLTADEAAELDARERRQSAERAAQQDAARRDRNLRLRYPNEAAHQQARAAALDDIRKAIDLSQKRLAVLAGERRQLMNEAEFYVGKTLPRALKQQLDGNDASTGAQRSLIGNQEAERVRINALFDDELERLRRLWAGGTAGTVTGNAVPAVARGVKPPSASPSAAR